MRLMGSLNLLQQEDYGAEILLGPDGHNLLPAVRGLVYRLGGDGRLVKILYCSFILGLPGPGGTLSSW